MKKWWLTVCMAACFLTGCSRAGSSADTQAGYRDDVSAQALVEAVASELGDDYWADTELPPEFLDDWYGISDDMYEEYYGQTPMISANVDALVVVKAAEGKLTDVENALDTYRESMVQDTFQYPINIPKIQASEVRTFGNYVCFVQLGADMDGMEDDDEAAIKACQEMNGRALSVIEKELTR